MMNEAKIIAGYIHNCVEILKEKNRLASALMKRGMHPKKAKKIVDIWFSWLYFWTTRMPKPFYCIRNYIFPCHGLLVMPKPISFRPDVETMQILGKYRQTHPECKSNGQAVLEILKSPTTAKREPTKPAMKTVPPTFASTLIRDSKMIEGEVKRLFRGQPSPYIEALLHMTETSVARSMCIATPRGLIYLIPSATHDI